MKGSFLIDNRYLINPEKNTVIDNLEHRDVKIEQRLLEVLKLLASKPNELVTRDVIISTVWNDYGGADEGLTQAISFLRKVLNDKDKTIIETIPKKGYALNATVSYPAVSIEVPPNPMVAVPAASVPSKKSRLKSVVIAILLLAAVIVFLYVYINRDNDRPSPDVRSTEQLKKSEDGLEPTDSFHHNSPDVLPDSVHRTP